MNLTFSQLLERSTPEVCATLKTLPPVAQDRVLHEFNRLDNRYHIEGFHTSRAKSKYRNVYVRFIGPTRIKLPVWKFSNDGPIPLETSIKLLNF